MKYRVRTEITRCRASSPLAGTLSKEHLTKTKAEKGHSSWV